VNGRDWRNAGLTQYASGNYTTAIASLLRARAKGEDSADFHAELALSFWRAGDRTSALREIHAAQEREKSFDVCVAVAKFLSEDKDHTGSARWLARAIELEPTNHEIRFHRALELLHAGDWGNGWSEYEARKAVYPTDFPSTGIPVWKGESLSGKFLWVTCEQGLGDQIMFSRYLPWLRAKAASLYFDSHPSLADFTFGVDIPTRTMAAAGTYKVPVHDVTHRRPDYMVSIMSLPMLHKTTHRNMLPPFDAYRIVSKPYSVKLNGDADKKKIGLVWAGSKIHPNDAERSMPLQTLIPLTGDDRFEFYSFQVGDHGPDVEKCAAELLIKHLGLATWMHTCAALRQMDAVVSVDTACAHMAASIGIKTYAMLAWQCDFRWGAAGETTPWYPTMKLIRQERPGDWTGVVRRVMTELEEMQT